jgi:hypothetical protein
MITLQIDQSSLTRALKQLSRYSESARQEALRAVQIAAINIEASAKMNVTANGSVDTGQLRARIAKIINANELSARVVSRQTYSSAIEFGRKPGSFPPVGALQDWVRRKQLAGTYSVKTRRRTGNTSDRTKQDKALAFVIARAIYRKGIKEKPFLNPAYEAELPAFRQRIIQAIKNAKAK